MRGRNAEILRFGPFTFHGGNGLWRGAGEVALPPRALTILDALVARPGEVVTKAELLDAGWKDAFVTDASLTEAIRVLRTALGDTSRDAVYIQTVHRRGYRFVAAVTREPATSAVPLPVALPDVLPVVLPVAVSAFTGPAPAELPVWRPFVRAGWAALAVTLAGALSASLSGPTLAARTARLSIALPETLQMDALQGGVAVSADGARIAFVAASGPAGPSRLFVREVGDYTAHAIAGSDGARDPFFAPDGRRLGFFAGGRLVAVDVDGRDLRVVADVHGGAGAAWLPDDSIVFGGAAGGGLARASARGGGVVAVATPAAGSSDVRYGWPERLPGGDGMLFTVVTPAGADLATTTARGGHAVIVRDARFGRYTSHGRLIAERDGQLMTATTGRGGRVLAGPLVATVTDVASTGVLGGPRFAVSASGALVYVPGVATGPQRLRWVREPQAADPEMLAGALVLDRDSVADARLLATGLAGDARAVAVQPAWRPDGLEVAFALNKSGPFNLFVRPRAGGTARPLGDSPWNQTPTSWSPDGGTLLFTEFHPASGADVWALDVATGTRRPLAQTTDDESGASYSPEGQWIAYLAHGARGWEVVVRPAVGGAMVRLPATRLLPGALGPAAAGRELRVILPWAGNIA